MQNLLHLTSERIQNAILWTKNEIEHLSPKGQVEVSN